MVQRHEERRPRPQRDDPQAAEIAHDPPFRFGAGYGDLEEERQQANERAGRKGSTPH